MSRNRTFLFGGLLVGLIGAASSAQAVTMFGLPNSPVGNATLTPNTTGGLVVGNLGSAGQDGVSIDLTNIPNSGTQAPSYLTLDTSINNLGTVPTGGFITQTAYGSTGGGTNSVVSTLTASQLSTGVSLAANFSPVSNGQPVTINYYSGGPGGSLVYSEQHSGSSLTIFGVEEPTTIYLDLTLVYASGGWDYNHPTTLVSAGGVTLPSSDGIDFVDISVPSNLTPQYSSDVLTAGGGIGSFTITGEAVTVPEPGLLGLTAVGVISLLRRRRFARVAGF